MWPILEVIVLLAHTRHAIQLLEPPIQPLRKEFKHLYFVSWCMHVSPFFEKSNYYQTKEKVAKCALEIEISDSILLV